MMDYPDSYRLLWRSLRTPEPNLLLRIAVSAISGLALAAAGIVGAWAHARLTWGWVYVNWALSLAGICWSLTLVWIWQREPRGRCFVVPAVGTVGVGVTALLGASVLDEFVFRADGLLTTALFLLACAIVILLWLPAIQRVLRGRPVVSHDGSVLVNCPGCNYSLVGLRDLRCPECGMEFTIDELIRAQDYGGVRRASAGVTPSRGEKSN